MDDLQFEGLAIVASRGALDGVPAMTLTWRGKSRSRKPTADLGPYLTRAVADAKQSGAALVMTFSELEYFNSGTVMAIVQTIHRARAEGVRLRVVYEDKIESQRLSFEPLRVFVKDNLFELSPKNGGEA